MSSEAPVITTRNVDMEKVQRNQFWGTKSVRSYPVVSLVITGAGFKKFVSSILQRKIKESPAPYKDK